MDSYLESLRLEDRVRLTRADERELSELLAEHSQLGSAEQLSGAQLFRRALELLDESERQALVRKIERQSRERGGSREREHADEVYVYVRDCISSASVFERMEEEAQRDAESEPPRQA